MTSKAAQYLNEIVSLTILVLMVVALISGQAAASKADAAAADNAPTRYAVESRRLERVVDSQVDPIVGVLSLASGHAHDRKLKRTRRPTAR